MSSRRGIPVDTRSAKTRYFGGVPKSATSMPSDAMAKGNSLAMNAEPRYLTTLKARTEARSARRWVSWMMQSDSDSMKLRGGSRPAIDMVTTPARPVRSTRSWMRHISPRSTRGSFSITRRTSIPSNTIRLAPISLARNSTAASRPLRSNVPACTAPGDSRPSTNASRGLLRPRFWTRLEISQPKDAALAATCWKPPSKATKMPGSSNRRAPFTNVWRANTVLPDPAGPASNVVRPRGNPPPVISSTPSIPVCAFDRRGSRSFWFLRAMPISVLGLYSNTLRQPQQDPRGGGQPTTRLTRRASLLVADGYSTVVPVDGRKVRHECLPPRHRGPAQGEGEVMQEPVPTTSATAARLWPRWQLHGASLSIPELETDVVKRNGRPSSAVTRRSNLSHRLILRYARP